MVSEAYKKYLSSPRGQTATKARTEYLQRAKQSSNKKTSSTASILLEEEKNIQKTISKDASSSNQSITPKTYVVEGQRVTKQEQQRFIQEQLEKGKTLQQTNTIYNDQPVKAVEEKETYQEWFDKNYDLIPGVYDKTLFAIKNDKGEIKGYEDTLSKTSIFLSKNEKLSESDIKKAERSRMITTSLTRKKSPVEKKYGGIELTRAEQSKNVFNKGYDYLQKKEYTAEQEENRLKAAAIKTGVFLGGAGITIAKFPVEMIKLTAKAGERLTKATNPVIYYTILNPAGLRQDMDSSKNIIKDPSLYLKSGLSSAKNTYLNIKSDVSSGLKNNPSLTAGKTAGDVAAPFAWSSITSGIVNIGSRIGKTKKEPSLFFSEKTLETKQLPTTSSSKESLARFNKASSKVDVYDDVYVKGAGYTDVGSVKRLKVSHATTAKLPKTGVTIAGPKGSYGLEDPGLFVTSADDSTSLRLFDNAVEYKVDVNPLGMFQVEKPRLIQFDISGKARKVPYNVLKQPGFSDDLSNFYSKVDDADVFITKRSMIGVGELKRKSFVVKEDFTSPVGSLNVKRNNNFLTIKAGGKVKAGDIIKESATSEFEGIIPKDLPYEITSRNKFYTVVDGKTILLEEGKISSKTTNTVLNPYSTVKDDFSIGIGSYSSPYSSSVNVRSVSPTTALFSGLSSISSSSRNIIPSISRSSGSVSSSTSFLSPSISISRSSGSVSSSTSFLSPSISRSSSSTSKSSSSTSSSKSSSSSSTSKSSSSTSLSKSTSSSSRSLSYNSKSFNYYDDYKFNKIPKKKKKKKVKSLVTRNKRYTPTAKSSFLGEKGLVNMRLVKTGLGERKIRR